MRSVSTASTRDTRQGPEAETERRPGFLRRFSANRVALVGLVFVALIGFVALFPGLLAPYNPDTQNLLKVLKPPGPGHWLGTDDFGRDQLSRLIYGARVSFIAAIIPVLISVILGAPAGVLAGYSRGFVDQVLARVNDAAMSVPGLILALTIIAALGTGLWSALLAIGIVFAPVFFRMARVATRDVREETFIEASRALGCSGLRTLWRHVLPGIMPPLIVQMSVVASTAVVAEASLSFLGLGVQPPTPSWGSMLATAATDIALGPYLVIAPGVMIVLFVLAITFIGDGVRGALGTRTIQGRDR